MSRVIWWDLSWLRWPDQCQMISVNVAYRPGRVLELTISIEVWLHPEEEPLSDGTVFGLVLPKPEVHAGRAGLPLFSVLNFSDEDRLFSSSCAEPCPCRSL